MSDSLILFMLAAMVLAPSLAARLICMRNDRAAVSLVSHGVAHGG